MFNPKPRSIGSEHLLSIHLDIIYIYINIYINKYITFNQPETCGLGMIPRKTRFFWVNFQPFSIHFHSEKSQLSPLPSAPYSDIAGTTLHCSPTSDAAPPAPEVLERAGCELGETAKSSGNQQSSPICSMYDIITYIWVIFRVDVR